MRGFLSAGVASEKESLKSVDVERGAVGSGLRYRRYHGHGG